MSNEDGDMFGLGREQRISKAGVRQVFTPHQPILSIELLIGRDREVQSLIEHLNTPGQHALLYGERGVGKSSLANIASNLILKTELKGDLYQVCCDSSSTFESVVQKPLEKVGASFRPTQVQVQSNVEKGTSLAIPSLAQGTRTKSDQTTTTWEGGVPLSPGSAAEELQKLEGLLVVDEVDAIPGSDDQKKLAELIKHLSDSGARFKVLLVGIAETPSKLVAGHPSVQRCLKETKLRNMPDDEIRNIVTRGAKRLGLVFDDYVVEAIVELSSGYPYFAHLLALKKLSLRIKDGLLSMKCRSP